MNFWIVSFLADRDLTLEIHGNLYLIDLPDIVFLLFLVLFLGVAWPLMIILIIWYPDDVFVQHHRFLGAISDLAGHSPMSRFRDSLLDCNRDLSDIFRFLFLAWRSPIHRLDQTLLLDFLLLLREQLDVEVHRREVQDAEEAWEKKERLYVERPFPSDIFKEGGAKTIAEDHAQRCRDDQVREPPRFLDLVSKDVRPARLVDCQEDLEQARHRSRCGEDPEDVGHCEDEQEANVEEQARSQNNFWTPKLEET